VTGHPASLSPGRGATGGAPGRLAEPDRGDRGSILLTHEEITLPAETHVERGPLDRQEVFDLIRGCLADILEVSPDAIAEGASFGDDLGADSLALIELVEALEEELSERTVGFRIDDEDLEDLKTVRDAVDYVMAKLHTD
jgi:acyl carrier protein